MDRVYVLDELRPVVQDFLFARERHLLELGLESKSVEPLVPNTLGKTYTGAAWNTLRCRAFRETGIIGNFRVLRPSFAMQRKREGNTEEDVSRMLRHTSPVTTRKFYAN